MTHKPRSRNDIYTSLRDGLTSRIPNLTNFTTSSFNWVWTQAFSQELREVEIDATAAYVEGFIDYSGGPIDENDLEELNLDGNVTVEELNDRLNDTNLDELVKIFDLERDPGEEATGTVTFTTQSPATTIPEETLVGIQPDAEGDFFDYTTNNEVSTGSGETTVDANITATEVGEEFNTGANTITYLPDPPTGVQSVNNSQEVSGGVDRETNDELRERAKKAIFQKSGGGTVDGMEGFVIDNTGASDIIIDEQFTGDTWHGSYPHGHVIVDGGTDQDVLDAIGSSRPVSVRHFLVRPTIYTIDTSIDVFGDGADTVDAEDNVIEYLNELTLSDDLVFNKVIQQVLNADDNISDVDSIDFSVDNETLFFNDSILEDFEDSDINILNRFWGDWAGDIGNFAAQTGTVLVGNESGELTSANEDTSVSTTRTSTTTKSFEVKTQIDLQTGNASDVVEYIFKSGGSGGTELGRLRFDGSGTIEFVGGSTTTVGSGWSAGTAVDATLQFDFRNDQVDVTVDGTTDNDLALANSVSDWDYLEFRNDTTASGSTVNAFTDDLRTITDIYSIGLGTEMLDDGIGDVTGTSGGNNITFTEGTDYEEYNESNSGTDDAIIFFLDAARPDQQELTATLEFTESRDEYPIDDKMVDEGITRVEDSSGTVYTEATDYEEIDLTNDGVDDAIQWLAGASQTPSNGQEFTVTYTASTNVFINYDITDADVTISDEEKINAGTVTVTEL